MNEIIPSILTTDKETFIQNLNSSMELLDMAQIDIADGEFVPNTTWSYTNPQEIPELLQTDFSVELHLMVEDPKAVIAEWKSVPQVKRVLVHVEAIDLHELLPFIPDNWELGAVLNPNTPLSAVESVMDIVQSVMFMGVTPGSQGQAFQPQVLEHIQTFKKDHPNMPLALDGAVNKDTLQNIITAGVTRVCPGSALFGTEDVKQNLEILQTIIESTNN